MLVLFIAQRPNLGVTNSISSVEFEYVDVTNDIVLVDSRLVDSDAAEQVAGSAVITPIPTVVPQVASASIESHKKDVVEEFTPTSEIIFPSVVFASEPENVFLSSAPEYIQSMIEKYASEYKANPALMSRIARCESGYRADAVSSTGAYVGLYQFHAVTWISNRNAMGLDPDPSLRVSAEEAVRTAAFKMGRDGYDAWPVCGNI